MVSPAPLHAVTAPVVVVERTHAALGVGEFIVQAVLLGFHTLQHFPSLHHLDGQQKQKKSLHIGSYVMSRFYDIQ
jgi:hypothetical protein